MRLIKRKSKFNAPCVVRWLTVRRPDGTERDFFHIECTYGGTRVGPVETHSPKALKTALQDISRRCDCGRPQHSKKYDEGVRRCPPNRGSVRRPPALQ
jgi:hypothetical protein